ncbi:MAG: Methylenetetrahydrofolate reductase, partial [Belnapia sp.]|nr:Methylenetetrahydrofolate reductase [Belnapia sp.]
MDQALPHDSVVQDAVAREAGGTLQRWLTGPRFDALPNFAAVVAPQLSFEFFP